MPDKTASDAPFTEEAAQFGCESDTLYGVIARPSQPARLGVVVIVGGPQTRVGSHRQFVLLSRALATQGFAVLRFDYRGMGDAEGDARDFLAVSEDVGKAIDYLQEQVPQVQQVALWGLCDGASAALLYCHQSSDTRVKGLCLLNPWVRSAASLARARVKHYYRERLMQGEFWAKLLGGRVAFSAIADLVRSLRMTIAGSPNLTKQDPSFQQRMALAWNRFAGKILLVLSGDDYTAKEFMGYVQTDYAWAVTLKHAGLVVHDVPEADHTFSNPVHNSHVERRTIAWLKSVSASVLN
jgi:exosortase A-associated hydrolase 1